MGIATLVSPVFQTFLMVVGGLLGVGGTVLWGLRQFSNAQLDGVLKTYRSWWVIAPLPFIALLAGREVTIFTVVLLSIFAFVEFARATKLLAEKWMTGIVCLAICIQGLATLVTDPVQMTEGWYGMFMTMPVFVICAINAVPIMRNRTEGQLRSVCLAIFGYLYFGWMLGHLAFLMNFANRAGYLLFLIFAVSVTDVAAFVSGKLFGRRKLRDRISPNKTVGGSLGALSVSMLLPWMMRFALPGFTPIQLLLTGLIVGIGAQMGDLTVSYIKRDLGIKDMGGLIPGHGGLLDRIDSLIFTAPLFFHMVRWYT